MVGVVRRMNKLRALLNIRHGPGAAILPSEVSRIHMEFAKRGNEGQLGPRKFWQTCLPRLKFWNPSIPMIVNRVPDTAETPASAIMTIYFKQADTSGPAFPVDSQPNSSFIGKSKAPEPSPAERAVQIDMKGLRSEAILEDFLAKTKAVPLVLTEQEEAELLDVRERAERSKADREVMRKFIENQRREAAILAQAKSEVEAMNKV